MNDQLTLDEVKALHGQPVWCHIPSDNPAWGIVDAANKCVMLGRYYMLTFDYYGEWKAFKRNS